MQAVELHGKIDNRGYLNIDLPFVTKNRDVKVIVLFPEDDFLDNQTWLSALNQNPAFDFLKDEEEDIYSINDGKPVDFNKI